MYGLTWRRPFSGLEYPLDYMLTYMDYLKLDPRFGADMATRINAVIKRERRSATHEAQTRWPTQNPGPGGAATAGATQ